MQKVYLVYAGRDGDSGYLYKIFSAKDKAEGCIKELGYSFDHPFAEPARNLYCIVYAGKNLWMRIDEFGVD